MSKRYQLYTKKGNWNPKVIGELQRRVARGRTLLVKKLGPHYYEQVDPASLRMASSDLCMLGQLFGDYWEGARQVALDPDAHPKTIIAHGFLVHQDNTAWWGEGPRDPSLKIATVEDLDAVYGLLGDLWIARMRQDAQ